MTNLKIELNNLADPNIVKEIGGATLYKDGALICWGFECVCEFNGDCTNCPTNISYYNSCMSANREHE